MESFNFIISLAAVINGLGIVRCLGGFSEYLRHGSSLNIKHYWVFSLFLAFQFLMHILLWWSLWTVHNGEISNFLVYLYLLTGPILLYLGTGLLIPDAKDAVDLKKHYFGIRQAYSTVLILLWLWAIFLQPVLQGKFTPATPIFTLFLIVAIAMRATTSSKAHGVIAILFWLLLITFIAQFAIQLESKVT